MGGNPFLSGRIPQDLYEKVNDYCGSSGMSRTELMIAALRTYLDYPETTQTGGVDAAEFEKLKREIKTIWKAIEELQTSKSQVEAPGGIEAIVADNYDNSSDNVIDNRVDWDNLPSQKFPEHLLNESAMAELMNITRSSLRTARKNQEPSTEMKQYLEAMIEDEPYTVWYWGTERRGQSRQTHIWAAHPLD